MVRPFDGGARRSELLVRITGETSVNLHFVPVCGGSVRNVETFGATEDCECPTRQRPLLTGR